MRDSADVVLYALLFIIEFLTSYMYTFPEILTEMFISC